MRSLFVTILFFHYLLAVQAQQIIDISLAKGLATQQTLKVTQDKKGFIWVSTRFGIERYDGYQVQKYEIPLLTGPLPVRNIDVITDKYGTVWAYTGSGGIYRYNDKKDAFELFRNLNIYVRTASFAKDNAVWFGTNQLFGWLVNHQVSYFRHPLLKNALVKKIIDYQQHQKLIITDNSVLLFDVKLRKLTPFFQNKDQKELQNIQIESAHYDPAQRKLWLGSTSSGLLVYDLGRNTFHHVNSPGVPVAMIMSFASVNDSTLLIGTDGKGAWLVDKTRYVVKKIMSHQSGYHDVLSGDAVYDIFKDKDGRMWMATSGGVNLMDTEQTGMQVHSFLSGSPNSLVNEMTTCMLEDSDRNLWFGTNGGLSFKNTKTNQLRHFLKAYYIQVIFEDSAGNIWVGTYGAGIYVFSRQGELRKHFTRNMNGRQQLATNFIYAITEDAEGNIWCGGKKGLMTRYDPKTDTFRVLPLTQINYLLPKNDQVILAATEIGLFEISIKDNSVRESAVNRMLKSRYICDLFKESDSIFWMATYGAGLARYNTNSQHLRYIPTDGRGGTEIAYSIIADNRQHLWVSTQEKISSVDTRTYSVKNHSKKSMPLYINFMQTSRMKTEDGSLYFGGTKGYISFHPDKITSASVKEPLIFLNFSLFNRISRAGDKDSPLKVPIDETAKIVLSSRQHSFSLSFTTINFSQALTRRFMWKLDGLDKDWIGPSTDNLANYTNLSPKKYTFHLKAVGNNNETLDERTLEIVIKPAFYNTWIAYFLYVILIAALIYWFIHETRVRVHLKSSLIFEKKEKERTEELTQSKLQFFTNVSHELRTPVTLIMGQAERLLHTTNVHPSVHNKLISIHKNATNLGSLVNELLDFRKQDQGHLQLKIAELNLISFLQELYLSFLEHARQRKINFKFTHGPETEVMVWIDPEQMQKVVYNLLSNAFKATSEGGTVHVGLIVLRDEVEIAISDTGKGIAKDKIAFIFNQFYQIDPSNVLPGTGIGLFITKGVVELHGGRILVTSESGQGSTFTVVLRKGDEHFAEDVVRVVNEDNSVPTHQQPGTEELNEIVPVNTSGIDKKLLLVEDNKELQQFLKDLFSSLYLVETADDGVEGLKKAREMQPDIIVSDIMMPGMSGIALCTKIKSNFDTCHIPVILLTAKTALEHKFEGLRIGADDYITKPFNSKLLVLRCNNLVNSRAILQSKYIHQPGLMGQQEVATTEIDRKFIERATAIVNERLADDIDVNTFAAEMGLSRSSLFSKLKGITGLAPNQFISNIRLKKAADMLRESSELNISEIAYDLGFSSPRYFNKCFKDLYGYAPQEYRKVQQKKA